MQNSVTSTNRRNQCRLLGTVRVNKRTYYRTSEGNSTFRVNCIESMNFALSPNREVLKAINIRKYGIILTQLHSLLTAIHSLLFKKSIHKLQNPSSANSCLSLSFHSFPRLSFLDTTTYMPLKAAQLQEASRKLLGQRGLQPQEV